MFGVYGMVILFFATQKMQEKAGISELTCDLLLCIACEVADLEAGLEDVYQVHIRQESASRTFHQRQKHLQDFGLKHP